MDVHLQKLCKVSWVLTHPHIKLHCCASQLALWGKWYMDRIYVVGELYGERLQKKEMQEMAAVCPAWCYLLCVWRGLWWFQLWVDLHRSCKELWLNMFECWHWRKPRTWRNWSFLILYTAKKSACFWMHWRPTESNSQDSGNDRFKAPPQRGW